jgi:hypothetical protein
MFLVSAAAAAAIRQAYEVDGEPGALAELRVQFPEVVNDETAAMRANDRWVEALRSRKDCPPMQS